MNDERKRERERDYDQKVGRIFYVCVTRIAIRQYELVGSFIAIPVCLFVYLLSRVIWSLLYSSSPYIRSFYSFIIFSSRYLLSVVPVISSKSFRLTSIDFTSYPKWINKYIWNI